MPVRAVYKEETVAQDRGRRCACLAASIATHPVVRLAARQHADQGQRVAVVEIDRAHTAGGWRPVVRICHDDVAVRQQDNPLPECTAARGSGEVRRVERALRGRRRSKEKQEGRPRFPGRPFATSR